jgi:Luciferase-like monooxygenase
LRYGLELPNGGVDDVRGLVELGRLAEQAGWDGVFMEDHVIHHNGPDAPTYDPWMLLTGIALGTERVRLGPMVTPLARRRPWKVAREAVTLDYLSNGRVILGVGLGDTRHDEGIAGVGEVTDDRRRAVMLDEALDVVAGLWSGLPFSYTGQHFQIHDVTFSPPPLQQPRIPIWVGGKWPLKGPMERAARWDGFHGHKVHGSDEPFLLSPADVEELKTFVASRRPSATPFDIAMGGASRGDDWEGERDVMRSLAEAGATWWIEYIPPDSLATMRAVVERGPLRIGETREASEH